MEFNHVFQCAHALLTFDLLVSEWPPWPLPARTDVGKANTRLQTVIKLTFVANVGFIRYVLPCLSDSDEICGIWNVPGIPDSHPGDYPAYLYRLVTNIYSSVRPACSRLEFRGLPCSGKEAVRPNSFSWAKSEIFFFFRGALRPQKAYGLLGTAEEWDRECRELRPTSAFTQLQLARGQGSDRK